MSKKGHIPMRMCMGCRKRRKKEEMVRFTRSSEGGIVSSNGKKNLSGRGFYLCPDMTCLKMAQKKNRTGHLFGVNRPPIGLDGTLSEWMVKVV